MSNILAEQDGGFRVAPIGVIQSCFKERFGIPRQPGLVPAARAQLELLAPYNHPDTLRGIEAFSHLWLIFVFHGQPQGEWSPLVRPPRLGGNQKVGVFASRSPFRPNSLGLSLVRLEGITRVGPRLALELSGADLLDGTPVLDIKPYLPYAEAVPDARGAYAGQAPAQRMRVEFTPAAEQQCADLSRRYPQLRELVEQLLALDPRPAYRAGREDGDEFGMRLYDFDLKWTVAGDVAQVVALR